MAFAHAGASDSSFVDLKEIDEQQAWLRRALPRRALNTELVCSILNVQVFAFGIVHKLQFFGGRRGQFS